MPESSSRTGSVENPGAMRLPIGSSFGKYCRASASLTISTGGALRSSRSVKSRPFTIGMPIVLK